MKIKRKSMKLQKLNLIPILDAVFIFIFFLLMSAQFIEIYEIDSDAPAVKMVDKNDSKKKPLNLTLIISNNEIKVHTGVEATLIATILKKDKEYDLNKLKETLISIKLKHSDEKSIVLRPKEDVPYNQIIKIIDTARKLAPEDKELIVDTHTGKKKTKALFEQIIFETLI